MSKSSKPNIGISGMCIKKEFKEFKELQEFKENS